jgi:hypothetical protein
MVSAGGDTGLAPCDGLTPSVYDPKMIRPVARIAPAIAAVSVALIAAGCANSTASRDETSNSIAKPETQHPRERVSSRVKYLPLGRVRLDVVSRHRPRARWGDRAVSWYLGSGSDGPLRRVTTGRTREVRAGVTRMTVRLSLPRAGRFRFAACFSAQLQAAIGLPGSHGPCPVHRLRAPASSPYVGAGIAPAGDPGAGAIAAAASYLRDRRGYTSFAVVDSEGRMHGRHRHRVFDSASVVKAMLLVAYLRQLAAEHRPLDANSRSLLEPMIHLSDNDAATAIWELVGDERLRVLAHRTRMDDFSIDGVWGNAQISAADQARFFFAIGRLVPSRFRPFAKNLLSHIVGYESWGIPAVARPRGWTVFFKGGWRGTWRGQLVHQIGRLVRPNQRVAIAVMTDGNPSMGYGIETIEGVTARLLQR